MSNIQKYTNNLLTIEIEENKSEINIHFKGRSNDRDPSNFLLPILMKSLQNSKEFNKKIIMNFQELEYMTSSTIKPIIQILENTKNTGIPILIIYNQIKKWQELGFSALKIFETQDRRIEITGK